MTAHPWERMARAALLAPLSTFSLVRTYVYPKRIFIEAHYSTEDRQSVTVTFRFVIIISVAAYLQLRSPIH